MVRLFYKLFKKIAIFTIRRIDFHYAQLLELIFPEKNDGIIYEKKLLNQTCHNIAIIAMWQNKLCPNFYQALESLVNNGFEIVAVNNREISKDDKIKLEKVCMVYHERKPGKGRDFGAYKQGVRITRNFIEKTEINKVLFMNDSVYIFKNRFDKLLHDIKCMEDDVIGITETTELHYHISSWFFVVSKQIFLNDIFQSFWDNYKSYQSRVYSIHKGEVGLTKQYIKLKKVPRVIYSSKAIIEELQTLKIPSISIWKYLRRAYKDSISLKKDKTEIDKIKFWTQLEQMVDGSNQTAFWQLIAIVYLQFPFVKKETYSREVFNRFTIQNAFEEMVLMDSILKDDAEYSLNDMLSKITKKEESVLNNIKIRAGIL